MLVFIYDNVHFDYAMYAMYCRGKLKELNLKAFIWIVTSALVG